MLMFTSPPTLTFWSWGATLAPPSWLRTEGLLSSLWCSAGSSTGFFAGRRQTKMIFVFFPQWPKGLRINIDLSKKNYNRWSWYKFDCCSLRLSVIMKIRQALIVHYRMIKAVGASCDFNPRADQLLILVWRVFFCFLHVGSYPSRY